MKKLFKTLLVCGFALTALSADMKEGKTGCEDGFTVDCKKNPELCKGTEASKTKEKDTDADSKERG